MKKLDWNQLLGFDQLRSEGDRRALANSRIGGKIGDKGCQREPVAAPDDNRRD
jgi:hypothetical protein